MSGNNLPWTDERTEALKALWRAGLSMSQIAKALGGTTRNAVLAKVSRLGLTGRRGPSSPKAYTGKGAPS